ncbi:MAG: nucleotidyltransferase [Deltaproteobacteria bacterium]|nr:nucleotidyltransferase [Deltaproteobacteria bacterium]
MHARLQKDLREFIECLNSNGVEYLIVGGFAVAFHGRPRFTGDIDFLVRPTEANAQRVMAALRDFGFSNLSLTPADLTSPGQIVQLGRPPNRIDLLTAISGVPTDEAFARGQASTLDGLPVAFIGRSDLIDNKRAAAPSEGLGRRGRARANTLVRREVHPPPSIRTVRPLQ